MLSIRVIKNYSRTYMTLGKKKMKYAIRTEVSFKREQGHDQNLGGGSPQGH